MRILTYNIRHGQSIGGLISLKRTAGVVSAVAPDLVGLNEVYRWPAHFDQAARIAELTGTQALFQQNTMHGPAGYGNALLSKTPVRLLQDIKLPSRREQRGCMLVETEHDGRTINVAVTHLGLSRAGRAEQIADLVRRLPRDVPLVLIGDMNCTQTELEPLRAFLKPLDRQRFTYPSWRPWVAYDHIMFSDHWTLDGSDTVRSLASDHLPLFADLHLG